MIVSDKEAYEKWCPFSRSDTNRSCVGSRCMAWRPVSMRPVREDGTPSSWKTPLQWLPDFDTTPTKESIAGTLKTQKLEPGWENEVYGYCGLAGKPK